ncbi:phosphopantetheine-binding protein [Vibrio parahaemolyticus]|uniref:phosphopantetheine-binding protein n=1 Tax=Vibrio parahaemolyticus TaxID=670 RepID=UPI00073F96B9|nr:phosphopantetheine-binding protein [Vibrio parahaemolyticus]KUH61520.1 phosphopantetheine-containing protein [Vibrio parahaemolyticus]
MTTTMQHIQSALELVLETDQLTISLDTNFDDDLDLDSVLFVQFLLTLEDAIDGLLFDPDLIGQSAFNNVRTLIDFIESHTTAVEV